ncbi:MAG TPA: AmmeMemoRadiSam system protein B [Rectinemataceae bacterium]|nr:AmmeMemoRadiSam system protein B [Rectinemataceae bacterium]
MLEHNQKAKIREAIVSGIFYPEDPDELQQRVAELIAVNRPDFAAAKAILSPHAGLRYSGDLAALAWNAARDRQPRYVVVLSPVHRPSDALIFLPESDFFDGPFGRVPVATGLVEEMMDCGTIFRMNDIPHFEEHGIEVQLPFMRALFPDAALLPVILGASTAASIKALATALDLVIGERDAECLVVVSSDLSGSATGTGNVAEEAERFLEQVASRDWKALAAMAESGHPSACGAGCLAAFMASSLAEGCSGRLLGRHDSAAFRESPDERVVHYAAIAFGQEPES